MSLDGESLVAPGPSYDVVMSQTRIETDSMGQVEVAADPEARVHLYGKQVRPGRKIGHVTISGDNLDDLRTRARRAAETLRGAPA